MEMQEITEKEDQFVELEERPSVLETSVDKHVSSESSKQNASENVYVETGPGNLPTTDTPACLLVEGAESTIYSQLTSPSQDIYAEANRPDLKASKNVRMYRALCLVLSLICLALLLVIIALWLKPRSQPSVCHETETSLEAKEEGGDVNGGRGDRKEESFQGCSLQKCQALYSEQLSHVLDRNKCENGWLYFESTCYFLSKTRMPWNESRGECRKRGGDLAVISNRGVQSFLTEKGNLMYWIGLRERMGTWVWVNNTVLEQSYWSEVRRYHDCGLLSGRDNPEKSWDSSPCHVSTFYICQKGQKGQTTAYASVKV